jgi:hypothetical protein
MDFDRNKWEREYRKGIRISKCHLCGKTAETEFTSRINTRQGKMNQVWLCIECYADSKLNYCKRQAFSASSRGRPFGFPRAKGIYGLQKPPGFYSGILTTAYR